MNNETNTRSTMNKVINLPKRYSFEYLYNVDGCIFQIEQCSETNLWHLTGYASQADFDTYEPFLQEASDLKRHFTHFMKYTFTRERWGI